MIFSHSAEAKQLKTDIKLLRELLKEEKLLTNRLRLELQKEKLNRQVDRSPTYQMQKVKQEVEQKYAAIVEEQDLKIQALENQLVL